MAHTPGKLTAGERIGHIVARGEASECVLVIPHPALDGHGIIDREERRANLHRLVHCWNCHDELLDILREAYATVSVAQALAEEMGDDITARERAALLVKMNATAAKATATPAPTPAG